MADLSMDRQLWVRRFHPSRRGASRLVCLPHAGGSASFYFPVSAALSPDVDVVAVQYPGRQDRRFEPAAESIEELADSIFRALGSERDGLALFGHSMGAVVGLELARRLQDAGSPPAVLFASGRRGPSVDRAESVHKRDDAGLIAEILSLNGTDPILVQEPQVLEMILPALRADYRLVEVYQYCPAEPLSCPVVALIGDADRRVDADEVQAWRCETTASFELHVFPGGHFYLIAQQGPVIDQVRRSLLQIAGHLKRPD